MTRLEDRRDRLTGAIGFLEAPSDDVAAALRAWRAQIHGAADVEHLSGGLVQNVGRLEPLTGRVRPRELVVGTAGGRWTALFDCGVRGGDPVASVGHLSRSMGVQGVVVVRVAGVQAARQLQLFGPLPTDFLNYVRTISVVQDGSRWRFDAHGVVQDFEEVEAYAARRVKDRLTPEMLQRYCRALGLEPFAPDFYVGPSCLVTNPSAPVVGTGRAEDEVSDIAVSEIEAFFGQHRPGLKLPDGWFGRPFDDQHELTAVRETDDGLVVELDGRLRMLLRGPVEVAVEPGRRLVLTGFTSLSWERQDYGSSGRVHRTEYGPGAVELIVPAG